MAYEIRCDFGKLDECLNTLQSVHNKVCDIADEDVQDLKNKISNYLHIEGVSEVVAELDLIYQNIDSKVIFEINNTVKLINAAKNNYTDIESGANKKIEADEYNKILKGLRDNYNINGKEAINPSNSALGGALGGAIGAINKKIKDANNKKSNNSTPSGMGNDPRYKDGDYAEKYLNFGKNSKKNKQTNSTSTSTGSKSKSAGNTKINYTPSNTKVTTAGVVAGVTAASQKKGTPTLEAKVENQIIKQGKTTKTGTPTLKAKVENNISKQGKTSLKSELKNEILDSVNKKQKDTTTLAIEELTKDDLKNIEIVKRPYPPTEVTKPDSFINDTLKPTVEPLKPLDTPTNNIVQTPTPTPSPAPAPNPSQQIPVQQNPAVQAPTYNAQPKVVYTPKSTPATNIPEPTLTPTTAPQPQPTTPTPSITEPISDGTSSDLFGTDVDDFSGLDDTVSSVGTDSSTGGSGVIPIAVGLGAAGAVGIGAKVYKDRKENNDLDLNDDRLSNENKFWTTDDSQVIHSEKEEYLDQGTMPFSNNNSIPSYSAIDNDNINKDTWEVEDTGSNSDMVNLLGNE